MMTAVFLALAAGTAATTITKAKIFEPVRRAARSRSVWAGYLLGCPYCVTHWLGFALEAVYRVRLVHGPCASVDYIVTAMTITGGAAVFGSLLRRLHTFSADVAAGKGAAISDAAQEAALRRHDDLMWGGKL